MVISGPLITALWTIVKDCAKLSAKFNVTTPNNEERLQSHIVEIERWSETIQFFGMSAPLDTDMATIALNIASKPRRFTRHGADRTILTEENIVNSGKPTIILGDPGAGKTTTIKRIVKHLVTEEPYGSADHFNFPMLLRARDFHGAQTLFDKVSEIIGVESTTKKTMKIQIKKNSGKRYRDKRTFKLMFGNFWRKKVCCSSLTALTRSKPQAEIYYISSSKKQPES